MENNNKKIEELEKQISNLKLEDRNRYKDLILPFLREHATLHYGHDYTSSIRITFADEEITKKFIDDLENGSGSRGFSHFEVEFINNNNQETVSVRYDDCEITLRLDICGKTSERFNKQIKLLKELNLKISFTEVIKDIKKLIERNTNELNKIHELEKQFGE